MQMVRTAMWILERDVGTNYFRARRTNAPSGTPEELQRTGEAMIKAVGSVDRSHLGLLVDAREGPLRNDAEFEAYVRPWQAKMISGFARVAVLVKTPVGKLQTERLASGFGGLKVFTDEAAAIAYVSSR